MRARLSHLRAAAAARRAGARGDGSRPWPGWFIAVEGGDGTGKSTQITALAAWLRGRGYSVVTTREPGGTELGVELRELLLHSRVVGPVSARAEALLFAADRADHMEKIVRPALERGAIVLTDRHVDSSIAYQSGGRGLAADDVAALSAFATEGARPDLTILLDLDPVVAWTRARERADGPDRLEAEPTQFHTRVREAFSRLAAANPERYLVVDATEPPAVITAIVQDHLERTLPLSAREAAEAVERERALRAAIEAERQNEEALRAALLAEAARQEEKQRAEQEAAAREAERALQEAALERARRAAEEATRAEEKRAQEADQAEAERKAAEARAAEARLQAEADAERRRDAERAVRAAEAKAKEQARSQAARDLEARAASEARTTRLVESALATADTREEVEATKVLPSLSETTQVLTDGPPGEDEEEDKSTAGRWRRSKGRK